MENYFTISELCIIDEPVPQDVADKLLLFHIVPMNQIRAWLNDPIWASQQSGWRPKSYERENGRAPTDPNNSSNAWSRHTFEKLAEKDPKGKGAVDWTTKEHRMSELGRFLAENSPYTRICYYPNEQFYHCDYGYEERGQTLFVNEHGWNEKNKRDWLQLVNHDK